MEDIDEMERSVHVRWDGLFFGGASIIFLDNTLLCCNNERSGKNGIS
jgi:hypothetical protein